LLLAAGVEPNWLGVAPDQGYRPNAPVPDYVAPGLVADRKAVWQLVKSTKRPARSADEITSAAKLDLAVYVCFQISILKRRLVQHWRFRLPEPNQSQVSWPA